jgi:hypothetical protein
VWRSHKACGGREWGGEGRGSGAGSWAGGGRTRPPWRPTRTSRLVTVWAYQLWRWKATPLHARSIGLSLSGWVHGAAIPRSSRFPTGQESEVVESPCAGPGPGARRGGPGRRLLLGAVLRHTSSDWTPFFGRIERRSVLEGPGLHPDLCRTGAFTGQSGAYPSGQGRRRSSGRRLVWGWGRFPRPERIPEARGDAVGLPGQHRDVEKFVKKWGYRDRNGLRGLR